MQHRQPGQRLQIRIAAMRHRGIGEKDHRVQLARGNQGTQLLVAAARSPLQAADGQIR